MTAEKIKNRIAECISHFCFDYQNKACGVDPIYSPKDGQRFEMWYGEDDIYTAHSVDDVMTVRLFGGKSLNEIAEQIDIIDF